MDIIATDNMATDSMDSMAAGSMDIIATDNMATDSMDSLAAYSMDCMAADRMGDRRHLSRQIWSLGIQTLKGVCSMGKNSLGRSPPQELEVGPRSWLYLLV